MTEKDEPKKNKYNNNNSNNNENNNSNTTNSNINRILGITYIIENLYPLSPNNLYINPINLNRVDVIGEGKC